MPTKSHVVALAESLGISQDDLTKGIRRGVVAEADIVGAAQLLAGAWAGSPRMRYAVNEALTQDDLFRNATGDVLDRELVAAHATVEAQWKKYSSRTTVADFRPKGLVDLVGGSTVLPKVPEHSNYPIAGQDRSERTISVHKTGEQFGYSFEARIGDRLNELQRVPQSWAEKCVRTEDFAALGSIANPLTGAPNGVLFNAENGNLGSLPLTAENLEQAITMLQQRTDAAGTLIASPQLQLVVGPAQQFTAQRIVGAAEIRRTDGSVTTVEANVLAGLQVQVVAGLPGAAWFLLPVPASSRPASFTAFLSGQETPDVRYKADQGRAQSGGDLGVDSGSFDDDTIWWRVRHIVGGAPGDPTFAYASVAV